MEKKIYEKPTMQVVKLQHQTQLMLQTSQVNATMNGVWEEEDI